MGSSAAVVRLVLVAGASFLASCGGGDICLNCSSGGTTPGTTVTDTGNILRSFPVVRPDLMTVSICIDEPAGVSLVDCQPDSFAAFPDSDGSFTASTLPTGGQQIFFWVDENGDGVFADPDPIARLDDPDRELDDLRGGQAVTLANVDITFDTKTAAAEISVTSATPSPAPSATPTP